jgi:MBG domain-containing protein/Big-like domain-containing protein/centrosomal CEP192-like protein/HYDIN/CFA65/VesB family protein
VGTYPITCSGAVDPNFTIGYVAGILTVTPAPLVITAPSPTMLYGGPLPTTLSPTYASFVAGDTAASLTPQPFCTTTATTASPVGTYPVTCSGAVDANYTISYVAGTLTVNPAVVTVTASSATMTYGGLPPAITPSYSGFVLNQTSAILTTVPTCSTTATSTSPVSPPTIPSTCSGAAAPNYTFNYVPGAVTVIGAPLTITANTASKVYGTALTLPGTAFTVTGLLNTDTVTSVTLTSPGTLATAPVGSYPIAPSAAVGTGLANYTITYSTTGTLTVTPAGLTITAKPASKVYGQLLTFVGTEFTATGLLNTDTVTTATLTSAGTPATAVVGTYPIVPSAAIGTGLGNYTIAYANGVLTVTRATTTTAITSNLPNPAILGQIVTVRFGVAPQFTQTPTGTVTVNASTGETCSGALAAGVGSCPLTFFIGGPRTLTATYNGDPNFLGSASPTANQLVSGISLSTTSLLFGDQVVGTASAVQTVTLSNVGTTTITFTSITWSANFSGTNNCGTSLAPGRSCRINVRFVPTTTGVLTGTLTIVDSDPTNPQVVTLTGTGVTPILQVSPGALTFSSPMNVRTASQPVTVSNTGTAPLTINNNSIYLGGANAGQFAQLNNCVGTLAPGANCTVNVTFMPTFGAAPKNAVLNVTAAAPATPQTVTLTGTVIVPTFTLTPNPLPFGNQLVGTTSASQPITMTNTSTAAVTINSISLGGNVQFAQTNNCGASLAGGASCTINVTFKPTSRGIKNATLTVFVAAPATAQSVTLTGTGQ